MAITERENSGTSNIDDTSMLPHVIEFNMDNLTAAILNLNAGTKTHDKNNKETKANGGEPLIDTGKLIAHGEKLGSAIPLVVFVSSIGVCLVLG